MKATSTTTTAAPTAGVIFPPTMFDQPPPYRYRDGLPDAYCDAVHVTMFRRHKGQKPIRCDLFPHGVNRCHEDHSHGSVIYWRRNVCTRMVCAIGRGVWASLVIYGQGYVTPWDTGS